MKTSKKKLNLTIDEDVLERAKLLVERRGGSLSQLVEGFLARLSVDINDSQEGFWLTQFHRKYLPPDFTEPSDKYIDELKKKKINKYQ